jgi:hypothetical protein
LCILVAALPAALLSIVLPGLVRADDSPVTVAAPLVGEFQIGKQGRFILLPVTLGSRKVFCLVDTGASLSGFDESLKPVLGQPRGHRKLKTPGGSTRVEEFDWPDAKLRDQPLATDRRIVVVDLAEIRQATNDRIYGVIGMDVLRKYRLQIDFDAGWLRFLESLPANTGKLGERIPMEFTDEGTPFFVGSLGDQASDRFLIDTGTQGNSLEATVFDELREQDFVQPERGFANVTLAGELRGRRGKLDRLTVGPFTREGLRVSRINFSSVGLHYLSRFRITFDFPGRCAYLQ